MATTEIAEKEMETACPGKEFFAGLALMLQQKTKIKIALVSDLTGDICFIIRYSDLGVTPKMLSHPFCRTNEYANFLGTLLVAQHLPMFCDRVMGKGFNYDALVKSHVHRNFGLRTQGSELLLFQCHVSLVHRLLNESISQEITDEVAKVTLTCPKKVKRSEQNISITSFSDDDKNLRLVVTKCAEVRQIFKKIIETTMNFYGIKGKEVFINDNYFDYQIEITDAK